MRSYLVYCLLLIGASVLADATYTNHYVWTNSPFAGTPYNDWTNAAHDIQTAVSYASDGDTVWVTNGVYTNSLNGSMNSYQVRITGQITLQSVNGAAVTIIDGNYPYVTNMCIDASTTAGVIVDGFTIRNGYRTSRNSCGGIAVGWYDSPDSGTIKNCIVSGNRTTYDVDGNTGMGAGIMLFGEGGLIDNCVVSGNSNSFQAGGICLYNGSCTVQFCQVVGNISGQGGGINGRSTGVIKNCVISSNMACATPYPLGGGICIGGGTIQDCLISYNVVSTNGGGVVDARGGGCSIGDGIEVRNCTIVKNVSYEGGGIFLSSETMTGSVVNTIIDQNTISFGSPYTSAGVSVRYGRVTLGVSFTNCSLQCRADVAGLATTNDQCLFEINNGFVDTNADNFQLLSTSPCINTGTNQDWMTNAVALAGNPRIYNVIVDMGAYEYGSYVHYVSTNGTNDFASGYNTWAGAATQIQWAVTVAVDGDTVVVSNGVYTTTTPVITTMEDDAWVVTNVSCVMLTNMIILKSVNGPNVTVIDGNYPTISARGVYISKNATLDGFTVSNAYYLASTPPAYQDYAGGGGILIEGGIVGMQGYYWGGTVTNCIVYGNYINVSGGGIAIYNVQTSMVANCIIYANNCPNGGGMAVGYAGKTIIKNCAVFNNTGGTGGGLNLWCTPAKFYNCLFYGNDCTVNGGGVIVRDSPDYYGITLFNNCTIAGNTADNIGGGFIVTNAFAGGYNNIIYNNSATVADPDVSGTNSFLTNCCMSVTSTWTAGSGNITNNPLFIDAASTNYRLSANSPCINTGMNQDWITNAVDLAGYLRLRFGRVDIGVYEWYPRIKVNGVPYEKIRFINGTEPYWINGI